MVKANVLEINAKTGKRKLYKKDIELPKLVEEPKFINLEEVAKLLEYAKKQGWI